MIQIDRTAGTSVQDQLIEQLRFLIASGHFKISETLPSTRALARQVGISFHTVRKAYQELEREGLVEAHVGSGYIVLDRAPLGKSERMERGAAVVQEALHRLIGLGLTEAEVEHLVAEQQGLIKSASAQRKLLFAAPYREMADLCAAQIADALQQPVDAATFAELERHQDAEYVFTRHAELRRVLDVLPRADALGVVTFLSPEALERVARLLPHQTLGLVTRGADAIPPLLAELRATAGFSGPTLATSVEDAPLEQLTAETDLLLYTPPCRRRLLPILSKPGRHAEVEPVVSKNSLEHLRKSVPV